MRSVVTIVLAILLNLQSVPVKAQTQDAVNQAKQAMRSGCDDGIGYTFTEQQIQDATNDDGLEAFFVEHSACGSDEKTPTMLALCSPGIDDVKDGATIIACRVSILNPGLGESLSVSAKDFFLLANARSFKVDTDVSQHVNVLPEIVGQPLELPADSSASVVVAFDVPAQIADNDKVLLWKGTGSVPTASGELPGLQIIVHEREPKVANLIRPAGTGSPPEDLAIPTPATGDAALGAVDRAKARMNSGCTDGIGTSFTFEDSENVTEESVLEVVACAGSLSAPSLLGQCTPGLDGGHEGDSLVVCLVSVSAEGNSKELSLAARDFSLFSNTGGYDVDIELSKQTGPELDIASQPVRVPPGEHRTGVVAFDLPAAVADEDLVLQWTGLGPVTTARGELPGLQILVHDREPELAAAILILQPSQVDGATDDVTSGQLHFSGSSDDVIGPIDLDPGLYQVSARYTGDSNFVVWARQADGTNDLLVNEIGSYSGEATFNVETPTKVVLEVTGIGSWELRIEKLM